MNQKSNMHVDGESDGRTVPTKCPNKNGKPLAEGMEGRRPTKENIEQTTASQTQGWINASSALLGVRKAAKREREARFTAVLHHVTVPLLLDSFYALVAEVGKWWRSVVQGYFNYHAVPGNTDSLQQLPSPGSLALVPRTSTEKPEESDDLGTFRPACRSLDPECHDPAPASRYAL